MIKKCMHFVWAIAIASMLLPVAGLQATDVLDQELDSASYDLNATISADAAGASEDELNNATEEETVEVADTGTLIEIGNTTADATTIIVDPGDGEEHITLEIDNSDDADATDIEESDGGDVSLDDFIAGDSISYVADLSTNSDQLSATVVTNNSIDSKHDGRNGWITAIDVENQTVDVEWADTIYTLDLSEARIVAGVKNPGEIGDLEVGDRIRARVVEDGDGNELTWDAQILVVLRRGTVLFMRITRWAVPGVITHIPDDPTIPVTIQMEVGESDFYEEGDVNNLVGAPGTVVDVEINEKTKLVRKFLGRSWIQEFSEGDEIRVVGRRDDATGTIIAKVIKNDAIQRLDVANHFGRVSEINADDQSLRLKLLRTRVDSAQRTGYTINTSDETEIKLNGEPATFADIQVDDVVRARGTFSRTTRSIEAISMNIRRRAATEPNPVPQVDAVEDDTSDDVGEVDDGSDDSNEDDVSDEL